MLSRLHLVRHGEVHNPGHLVYADLPGFGLGAAGLAEARRAAARLSWDAVDAVVASPLQRAVETAAPIARAHGLRFEIDDRLTEWGLLRRWAGVAWRDLAERFPGEVDAYLDHPEALPFSPEPLRAVAERLAAVVDELGERLPGGCAVMVSHQDPVQAARLHLTGRPLSGLGEDKPGHGTVLTLEAGDPWIETGRWDPPRS